MALVCGFTWSSQPLREQGLGVQRGKWPAQGLLGSNSEAGHSVMVGPSQSPWAEGTVRKGRAQYGDKPCQGAASLPTLHSPLQAGLGVASFHHCRLWGQRSAPGRRQGPQNAALSLHTTHHPLPQASPAGRTARTKVSGCPAEEERKRALGPRPPEDWLRRSGERQTDLSS